jgi:hypothetical protein
MRDTAPVLDPAAVRLSSRFSVRRAISASVVGLVLFAALVVFGLPRPLARFAPDLALAIDPTNPVALIARADALRDRFLETAQAESVGDDTDPLPGSAAPATGPPKLLPGARRFATSSLRPTLDPLVQDREALRLEISALARRAIDVDPLNARAYRLLGEVSNDMATARRSMQTAVTLSRRETLALFWLLTDADKRGDFSAVVGYADPLLRTQPALLPFVAAGLARSVDDPRARADLLSRLAIGPDWRTDFLAILPKHAVDPRTTLSLLAGLRDAVFPPTQAEIQAYLVAMIDAGAPDLAHDAWRALLPRRETSPRGQLHNGDFDRDISGYAFDWTLPRGQGAAVEIIAQGDIVGRRALRLTFDGGRTVVPAVRQVVLLKPGRSMFAGRFKGAIASTRGLRWQIRCLYGAREVLGETEMMFTSQAEWQTFSIEFDVIDIPDCRAQLVTVVHDARLTSEQVISGDIQFGGLSLRAVY